MENHALTLPGARRWLHRAVPIGLLGLAFVLAACGSPRRSEPVAGPMQLADPSVRRGAVLYDTHCYRCHTEGEGGLAPSLNDKPLPEFLMRFQVRHGLGAMPAFSERQIGDRELDDIVKYLVALRRHGN